MTEGERSPAWGSSLSWQSLNVLLQVMLQLAYMSLLARWIGVEDFGVMAIALVVVGIAEMFAQLGMGPSLIQKDDLSPAHMATAWWFSAGLGLLFFAGMVVAAPWIAAHHEQPLLIEVLRWISLSFVISGFSVVSRSVLIRNMNFKALTLCALVGMVVGNLLVGLILAWNGAGIWAYVSALLVQNLTLSLGYLVLARVPIQRGFHIQAFRDLIGYGTRSTAFNMLTYAAAKIDIWLVGGALGERQTGWYDRAVYLMGLPITVLGKLGDSVLFSGMSSIQNELDVMRHVTLRAMHFVALLTFPLTAMLVVHAEGITLLFLGEKYSDAVPVAQVLFAAVAFRALTKLGDANLRAMDGLNSGILIKLAFLLAVGIGVHWALTHEQGLVGVARAIVLASALQWVLTTFWSQHHIGFRWGEAARTMASGLLVALAVGGALQAMTLSWWIEVLVCMTGATALMVLWPDLLVPAWSDATGDLRQNMAERMPIIWLRNRWEN